MAGITVTVGAITVTRTWANDAKVAETFRRYANYRGIDPALPNRERLEQAVNAMIRDVQTQARSNLESEGMAAVQEQAVTEIGLE